MTSTNANALPYNPLLERAHHVEELWRIVIPFCPPPGLRQIIRWQSRFSDDLIQRAFGAVSAKFEKGPAPESMEQVEPGLPLHDWHTLRDAENRKSQGRRKETAMLPHARRTRRDLSQIRF